jgi:predicted dehydrogenase
VANLTASRVGAEKIRKMRFFQPHDYVAVDYATRYASVSNLAPPSGAGAWPGVNTRHLEVNDVEPLRAEIESFLDAAREGRQPSVTGADGRRALSLATRVLERIHEHPVVAGLTAGG